MDPEKLVKHLRNRWKSAGGGFVIGGALGVASLLSLDSDWGLLFSPLGGLIGGGVGAVLGFHSGSEDIYYLLHLDESPIDQSSE